MLINIGAVLLFLVILGSMRGLAVLGERAGDGGLWVVIPYGFLLIIALLIAGYGIHRLVTWGL